MKIGEEVKENREMLCVNMVILKEEKKLKRMNSLKMRGKNEKFLKPVLKKALIVHNTQFSRLNQVTCKSPGQATRHLRRNFENFSPNVFRGWKFHPGGIREGSNGNFYVTFVIGASTLEKVASMSRKKPKSPDFEKNSKYFLRLGL